MKMQNATDVTEKDRNALLKASSEKLLWTQESCQYKVIGDFLAGKDVLVTLPTGHGKSFC